MITQLSLSNFKSWKRIGNMRFAPITGRIPNLWLIQRPQWGWS